MHLLVPLHGGGIIGGSLFLLLIVLFFYWRSLQRIIVKAGAL
jgi:hypothetical protein